MTSPDRHMVTDDVAIDLLMSLLAADAALRRALEVLKSDGVPQTLPALLWADSVGNALEVVGRVGVAAYPNSWPPHRRPGAQP